MPFEQCEGILTIHHSSNQPFTAIKIPCHSCVEQVNNKISELSSLLWRCVVRFLSKLTGNMAVVCCFNSCCSS